MSLLREYELIFGRPVTVEENVIGNNSVLRNRMIKANGQLINKIDLDEFIEENPSDFYRIAELESEGRVGLNIKFKVEKKSSSSNPNQAKITVYNLSDRLASYLYNNQKKNIVILLKAGYRDTGIKTIFKGTVSGVDSTYEGTLRKTTISCTDGGVNLKEANTNRSYRKGTSVNKIIDDLIDDVGVPKNKGAIARLPDSEKIAHNWYYTGPTAQVLKSWGENYDFSFSIQDGSAHWMPIDGRKDQEVVRISPQTGMIGSPSTRNTSGNAKQRNKAKNKDGIKVKCLLNGAILPETTVYIESDQFNTALKVVDVIHTGELEGAMWVTEFIGKVVDYEVIPSIPFRR